jgi:hypothetical protein
VIEHANSAAMHTLSSQQILIEILGWVAMLLILAAYGLLSVGRIGAQSKTYQYMNLLGAAGFVVNSGAKGAYPSAALNVIWIAITLYALYKFRH